MTTITSTEAGAVGRYINLGSPASQDAIGAQTVVVYAKPTGVPASTAGYFLGKTTSGTNDALRFAVVDSGSGPKLTIASHSSGAPGTPNRLGTANEITYNTWQHFTFTWDGSVTNTNMKLYVGATESAYGGGGSSGGGSIVSDAANDLFLMNRGNSGALTRDFIGDIGYIARWDRVLTSTELTDVRANGPLYVPSGLILCWANNQDYSTNAITATARSTRVTGSTPTNTALGGASDGSAAGGTGTGTGSGSGGTAVGESPGVASGGTGTGAGSGSGGTAVGVSIVLEAAYERSSTNLSGSSVTGVGDSAIISILPKTQEGEASTPNVAWADPSCDVVGVNGIRPTFRFLAYKGTSGGLHGYTDAWPSTRRPMFSYDDGLTWTYFSNATPDVGNEWIEFRHATAFTQNKVRIAKSRQTTVHQVGDWLSGLAATYSSFFVPTTTAAGYTPSGDMSGFAAQSFIADEFSPQTDSLGATIPAMPFYAAEINDTSLMPASGLPKRFATISNGVHAGENISVPGFRALVAFLCGSSAQAQNIRRHYRILIYPMMNAPGVAGGGVRGSWTQGVGGVDDPSRNFSSTGTGLEVVDIPRTCMDADRGAIIPDWYLDLHGMYDNTPAGYAQAIYLDDSYGLTERFRVLVSSIGGVTVPDMGEVMPTGAVSRYFKNQGVKMSVSLEQGDGIPQTDASLINHGEALAKAISAMIDEGAFFAATAGGTGTGTGTGTGGTATGEAGGSGTASGGTGTGTGTGSGGTASGAAVAPGGTGTGAGAGTGGDATGQIAGVVTGGTGAGTGAGSGGDAVGEVGGSASVTGGTGTGIGSGAGGNATGVIAGEVTGGTGVGVGSGTGGEATGTSANAYVAGGAGTGAGAGTGGDATGIPAGTGTSAPNGSGPTIIRPQTNRPLNVGGIRI
ncbi:MAG: hypothetical protein IPL29_02435 [Propionivibrio sp.]|nr:hypothetical protein [Propionivibrio sp.]